MAAEALILSMIQKLERQQLCLVKYENRRIKRKLERQQPSVVNHKKRLLESKLEAQGPSLVDYEKRQVERIIKLGREVIDELRVIVDILKDKMGEGRRLHYFISDLIEMADNALNLNQHIDISTINDEMEFIQSWIREIKECMLRFGGVGMEKVSNLRTGEGDNEDEDVVGLDEDVNDLLSHAIINEEKEFSTSLVTGMVGIGKTTLARQVYNHADVNGQFESRAWACVSSEISNKEILIELIQQVSDSLLEKLESADNTSLRQMLRQHLQGVRYFIVLDDVPTQMRLQYILKTLPYEDNGSRLLLTSPSQNITSNYTHRMETLDSNKSWQLFLKTISFGNNFTSELFPKDLENRGREWLKKCDGLPLAIKHVGKECVKKRWSGVEWEQVLESIDLGGILKLVEHSYDKLGQELKLCFLHLAFFKENTTYRAEKLVHIWAAGGMVSGLNIRSCVSKLNMESMIDIMDKDVYGNTRTVRINAVLHGLSKRKAEEEIGFEILAHNGDNRLSQNPSHRIIIRSRDKFNYFMKHGNKHLVSLFFHGGGYLEASPSYWNSFEQLRILDLEDFGIESLSESIGTLIELRYLGLRNNYIQELPDSLGCLKKLEVLDIAENFMVEVPKIVWEMGSLLHLYMSDVICRMPLRIDTLENLKTLTYITFDNWIYELSCLQMMTGLNKLGIVGLDEKSNVRELFASFAKLKNLRHLILRGYHFRSMPCLDDLRSLENIVTLKLDGLLPRLPSNFPPSIECLTLVNSRLDEDPMPILQKLSKLEYLKLQNSYTGLEMVVLRGGFPMLKYLFIEELWSLKNVQAGKGTMQKLNHLEIKNCPNLETLVEDIGPTTDVCKRQQW